MVFATDAAWGSPSGEFAISTVFDMSCRDSEEMGFNSRGKSMAMVTGLTVMVLIASIVVASRAFIARFDNIELEQTMERADQVARAFEVDLEQLAISTRDYAEWDDAQDFVLGREPDFLASNFSIDSLRGMHVDAVAILAADGTQIYSAVLPDSGTVLQSPAPTEMTQQFGALRPTEPELRKLAPTKRVIQTGTGLLAFSAVEIRRSDKTGATGAVMFFARFVRSDDIERVRRTSRLSAELTLIGASTGADRQLPGTVRAWLAGRAGEAPLASRFEGSDSAVGYALVSDMAGQPMGYFTTRRERVVGQLGRQTTWQLMSALSALILAAGVGLVLMTLRLQRSWEERAALESQHRNTLTDLSENQNRLAHLIEHDPLTELPNRKFLHTHLPEQLKSLPEHGQALTLLQIGIDRFKNINEAGGLNHGDSILKVVAKRLRGATSARDIVLRTGGDEFVIVASGISSGPALRALIERLLTKIREPIVLDEQRISLTASVGVSIYPDHGTDAETLIKHAGIALHEAKERGRDCYREFSTEMNAQIHEHLRLEQALHRALEDGSIYVEYQPVVDLRTGLLVSFEALARWRDPQLGLIAPGRFIPVAEKTGLIVPMTEQIIRKVFAQLSDWQRSGLLRAPVAINVAPLQFERTQFPIYVQETALEYQVDPRWLSFEVTESAWMQNSSKHVVMIDSLRHEGSRVYIDDFGTGFSNLSYLKSLPVDAVKIDQSFVRGIATDASDEAIVSGIIAMARQLNLATVAEGIETEAQAQRLHALGCLYGQGYYFSRPIAADKCRALLEQLAAAQRLTNTLTMRTFRRLAS